MEPARTRSVLTAAWIVVAAAAVLQIAAAWLTLDGFTGLFDDGDSTAAEKFGIGLLLGQAALFSVAAMVVLTCWATIRHGRSRLAECVGLCAATVLVALPVLAGLWVLVAN